MSWWIVLQILPVLALIYFYLQHKYSYWAKRGIQTPRPLPFLGNIIEGMRRGQIESEREWTSRYGKIYGWYSGLQPVLSISDPELIKQITIKDFGSFVNRRKPVVQHENDIHSLFNLQSDEWKRVRAITSPSFTSGKLRYMNAMMSKCVDKLVGYFDRVTSSGQSVDFDTKTIMTGFTIDVIASTSFATETNANDDRAQKNIFVERAQSMFKFGFLQILIMLLVPLKIRVLSHYIIPQSQERNFFYDLTREVVRARRAEPESRRRRQDLVQLLLDAKVEDSELSGSNYDRFTATDDKDGDESTEATTNGHSKSGTKSLTDMEILASSVLFFVAGFETTASTLTHCLFELATNQDIQDRLYDEVTQATESMDPESVEYHEKVVNGIPYLEAVMKETLRKYPPLARLERRVGVDGYKLGGMTLEKDQLISIGAWCVHHNPEYYPEPDRFNPDRFLPENKHLLTPYTYMPFGQGPRNCIGMRFAYQEIKLCLAKIVPKFRLERTAGTPEKMELLKLALSVAKTFPLKVSRR